MKKAVFALAVSSACMGAAAAADLADRSYLKAPAATAVVHSWTGLYVFAGAGAGMWAADSNVVSTGIAGISATRDQRFGGLGWFGTAGLGYDWQLSGRWIAGIFGDAQFGDISGSLSNPLFETEGSERLRTSYAAGARLGYLIAPNVLSYVNGGYSSSDWSGTTQSVVVPSGLNLGTTRSFRRDGAFIGGGVENSLDLFGVSAPGWFMKTEYRSAFYDRVTQPVSIPPVVGAGAIGAALTFKPTVQTISTSLIYRFN